MTKNAIKEQPKVEVKPKQKSGGGNIVTRNVGSVLTGAFLSKERAVQALPFIFFTVVLRIFVSCTSEFRSFTFRKMMRMRFRSNGFSMKSKAQIFIA